ncbi:Hypothetical predicted protein [Paramuricea clavata]|uniref:Uncharacterized protein n=1 Tax=Paramuricea clavata TaxID=317549 RepID=A0A6S7K5D3_PARCT|nr:Hypothetical predicted protein [Paramuricea clavata]
MRRTEHKLGEKRVFLGSLSKKNNLRTTYERLNLEEKAFISSTKFNQRKLLSRQSKLRQLQTNGNRGVNLETRPKTRTNFPDLAGSSDSVIRSYSNNLTLPYSRNGLRSPGEGKRLSSLLGKEGSIKQTKSDNINKYISQSNASNNFVDLKDVSTEKRNEIRTPFRSAKVDSKSKQVQQRSGLHVGDIIAYSASYGKRAKPQRRVSSIDQEGDVKIGGNEISERTNEDKGIAVKKPTVWMNDLHSSASTEINESDTRSLENENINSTKHIQHSDKNVLDPKDLSNNSTSRRHSPRVLFGKTILEENVTNAGESMVVPWLRDSNCLALESNCVTAETRMQADTNTQSNELTSESQFITSPLEHSRTQENDGPNVSTSSRKPNEPLISISFNSPQVPALVSRTPSWIGSKALPALGRIRRGSFCDVKTFTSGKVLDLLSSCEIPEVETKNSKQFLEVDNENLKYCRYLRSVTPEEASLGAGGEALEIPLKYRPSKNIIIGHTKVNLMQ